MDRLAALFEQLPLPEVGRIVRRTAISAIVVGIVALGVSVGVSRPFAGLGACVGLGLGLGNIRLVTGSVARVSASGTAHPRRVLAVKTLYRLGLTTLVVIGLLFASVQLGFGAAGGIAVFYLLLIVNLVRVLLQQGTAGARA
jgi:hypothetical protein